MKDLFPPDQQTAYGTHAVVTAPRPAREVGHFDYTDEVGNLLFQVVRLEPKGFYQRIKDPFGRSKDGWYNGLADIRRVLYRLPRLVDPALNNQPVLIVEGELKVHLLESWGFLATCNVGGAGMGWRDEYCHHLKDRRVVILPDNDAAGRTHADRVCGSLLRHAVGSVRIAQLPRLPDGGDIIDYAEAGGTRESFVEFIKVCREYRH